MIQFLFFVPEKLLFRMDKYSWVRESCYIKVFQRNRTIRRYAYTEKEMGIYYKNWACVILEMQISYSFTFRWLYFFHPFSDFQLMPILQNKTISGSSNYFLVVPSSFSEQKKKMCISILSISCDIICKFKWINIYFLQQIF